MIERQVWGAAPPKKPIPPQRRYDGLVVHWNSTFPSGYQDRDDEAHARWLRNIQAWSLNHPKIPFIDFPYNVAEDIYGNVYEGRGIGKRSGAEGPLKAKYRGKRYLSYFVMTGYETVGGEPVEVVPLHLDKHIANVNAVRKQAGLLDKPVLGHGRVRRAFSNGSDKRCPGPTLLGLVESGAYDVAPESVSPPLPPIRLVPVPENTDLATDLTRVVSALAETQEALQRTIRNLSPNEGA